MSKLSSIYTIMLVMLMTLSTNGEWDEYNKFYSNVLSSKGETYSFIVNHLWNGAKMLVERGHDRQLYQCLLDIGRFHEGYQKREIWALKMLDSSSQLPSGFLEGNIMDLGSFQECVEIRNSNLNITGQNCFVYFPIAGENLPIISNFVSIDNSICVPSSCSLDNLGFILQNSLQTSKYYPVVASCQTKESLEVRIGTLELVIFSTFALLGVFLLIGTVYDILLTIFGESYSDRTPLIEKKEIGDSKCERSILAFSLFSNGKELLKTDTRNGSIKCLYGLRFISACFIISIHRMLTDPQPFSNAFMFETELRQWYRAFQMNAYLFVDLFFVMSGLLISYKYSNNILRGKLNIIYYYLHRYIRLTPPLLACVLLELISTMFCNGPFCHLNRKARKRCLENGIYTLTYINNFVDPHGKCLLHSWYLSADMQMYFLAPILLLFMRKWRRSIPFLLFFCLAANILTTFGVSYYNELNAGYLGVNDFYNIDSKLVYEPFYTRAGPWIIGFGLGIILQGFNREQYRLSKGTVTIGWIIAMVCVLVAIFGVYPFVQADFQHDRISDSLYKAFHRNLFGLGCAWIIYACYTGHSDFLDHILSSSVLQPLGKITYCLYVIHPFVQMLQFRSVSEPRKYSDALQGSILLGDICYSLFFALILHLAVEVPTLKLENIFLSGMREKVKDKEEKVEMFKGNDRGKGQV